MLNIGNINFNSIEEFLKIGISSASSVLSAVLNKQINITVSEVKVVSEDVISKENYHGGILAQYDYIKGLSGRRYILLQKNDVRAVLDVLMNSNSSEDFEFDELSISTVQEILNQMAGADNTSLSDVIEQPIETSAISAKVFVSEDKLESRDGKFVMMVCKISINGTDSGNVLVLSDCDFAVSIYDKAGKSDSFDRTNKEEGVKSDSDEESGFKTGVISSSGNKKDANVDVHETQFPDFSEGNRFAGFNSNLVSGNIDLLMDVLLDVTVEIGKTRLKMKEIMNFTKGTIISLEKQAGAPVDVIVNGQLIARGDVVVIDDNFAVRITNIVGEGYGTDKK